MDFAQTSGSLDLDYLTAALERAGLGAPRGELEVEALDGGRTGTAVRRLRVGERSFVLKLVESGSWRIRGMGLSRGGEHLLWQHGVTRSLAGPIRCPVIDVAHDATADRHWVLMRDVAQGIRGRGQFSRQDSRTLVRALAAMQAPHLGSDTLDGAPLPGVVGPTDLFRTTLLHLSGRRQSSEPWVHTMVEDFQVMPAFLPIFLECLGDDLADQLLTLAEDDGWVQALGREPTTLLHGDLRRANMALQGEDLSLFDWEFASRGPAGSDLQWHCLLHYWAYPPTADPPAPDGGSAGDDCDDLAELYLQALGEQLGHAPDREGFLRGWQLGWIKAVVQLGYVLIDPLYPDGGDPQTRERVVSLCRRAVQRALDYRATLG